MRKALVGLGVLLLVVTSAPLFAQGGPFADVPTDHWAYDAVNELQQAGIVIGYPDGTFGGKRPMSRYEFAVAIARAIPVLVERVKSELQTGPGGTGPAGPQGPAGPAGPQGPPGTVDTSKFVTMDQFNKLQASMNEFKEELADLGVDVDQLKRDVAALAARVEAVEKEQNRVRWTGVVNAFATATHVSDGAPIDRDNRPFQPTGPASGDLINSVSFIKEGDLVVTGSLSPSVSAVADINFGNYLGSYLGGVITDYTGTVRPTAGTTDDFTPYYTYVQAGLGGGSLTIGRVPMQATPYTLKLIDVDSYTLNMKTDSGNYPLDGGQLNWKFGGFGLNLFAAKTNQFSLLGPGLVSQPTAGLYTGGTFFTNSAGTVILTGHAAGGLDTINQMAGARVTVGTPFKGNLGLTYFQAAGPFAAAAGYDTVDVYGADLNAQLASFPISLNAAQTRTKGDAVATIDDNNNALDGKLGVSLGRLGIDLGYKDIGNNFGAPGYWAKLGRWTNPTNIRGPYANITFPLGANLNFVANGDFYKGRKDLAALPNVIDQKDDKMWRAEGGLKWGFTGTNSVNLGWEYLRWDPTGGSKTKEQYISIGLAHQINPSAGFNIGYQIVDYKPAAAGDTPYGSAAYKGGVAVAQFNAKF